MTRCNDSPTDRVVDHTTRTVLRDLRRWTQAPAAARHLIDSVQVFDAAQAGPLPAELSGIPE